MSRCFPFPPPGYAGTCSSNEALILSIKLQRENEKANSDREREKAKSSDKKEKKREKKEKKRQREDKINYAVDSKKQKLIEKFYQDDKYKVESKDKCTVTEESEVLEKSSVTEEHGQPIDSRNASCSSDSTGNSSKRRKHSSSPSGIQTHGNIIRIRLSSSQKTDDPSTSGRKEQECHLPSQSREGASTSFSKVRPCSNLVKKEFSLKQKDVIVKAPEQFSNIASTSSATFHPASRQGKEVPCLPDKKIESVAPKQKLSSHDKKKLKKELLYKNLFESWVPPTLPNEPAVDEGDDEDWLFGKKGEEKPAKRSMGTDTENTGDSLQCCAAAVMQPRALYLPDADIYALPFTVPF